MTVHVLQLGGQRVSTSTGNGQFLAMMPSVEPLIGDTRVQLDGSKARSCFSLMRTFDFGAGAFVTNPYIPATLSPESYGETAILNYAKNNIIAVGDTIVTHTIPMETMMVGAWIKVYPPNALGGVLPTPFTFTLRVRGQAASVGGPIVLAAAINGSVAGSQYIDFTSGLGAPNNKPIYFNQNDAVEIIITALPANTVNSDGTNGGGIMGAAFSIAPIIIDPKHGMF